MTTPTTTSVLSCIRQWINRTRAETVSDADLLRRFTQNGDESAFALLMDRHGPMVLGAARRLIGDEHLAEDVFQAAFLTLARRARSLRRAAALPAWLHAVACRLALTALRQSKRRHRAECEALPRPSVCPADAAVSQEHLDILDEELQRLPERLRLPLVLCCLEGRSQAEAAALLGWTPGSLRGRLERGRQRLRDRLVRRGLTVTIAAAMPILPRPVVAAPLREAGLRAVQQGGSLSPLVSALLQETGKSLWIMNWKAILIVAVLGLTGTGVGVAARLAWLTPVEMSAVPPSSADESKPASPRPAQNPDDLPPGAVACLGWSPLRIGNAAFALTPDGRAIITVTPQGLVRKFDARNGRLLERRQITDRGDADPVGQAYAHLSADGRVVAIKEPYDGNSRLTVWDVSSGKQIFRRTSTAKRRTGFGALSPDGKLLALVEYEEGGGYKNVLRIAHLNSGRIREIGSLELNVYDVYFSADGKRLVASQISATKDGGDTLVYFDVAAGKELWRIPRKGINFALSPDGKTVLSPMLDQRRFQIIETDPASGKPTEREIQSDIAVHPNSPISIAPDNRTVVMDYFGTIQLWDLRARKAIRSFSALEKIQENGSGYGPKMGAISPDSSTLVTNVGHLQRWDLATGKPFFAAPSDDGLGSPIQHLAFTPDGKEIFASAWFPLSARWNLATGKRVSLAHQHFGCQFITTGEGVRGIAIGSKDPFGALLSDPVAGKTLRTIRWADAKEVGRNGLRAYTLTTNGKMLLAVHGKEPGEEPQTTYITACDAATSRRLSRFAVPGDFYFERSPFSPCGRWVAIGDKVYSVGSGATLFAPSGEPGEHLVSRDWMTRGSVWFSEDGRLLAGLLRKKGEKSASRDTLAVWELATGNMLARYPKAGFIAQVAFTPDSRAIAMLDGRGIRLEDLQTGKRLAEFAAPDVNSQLTDGGCFTQTLVFSPDGATLATGHQDGSILLWKVPRARPADPVALTDGEIEKLWTDLGSTSPSRARAAVQRLARHPGAVGLVAKRFRPPPADAKLAALLDDLDSDTFAKREEAARQIRAYGSKAESALRRTLAKPPSLEMRRRIENLLSEMTLPSLNLPLSGDRLRGVRAIEVLERAGNTAARSLLQAWAEQTQDAHLAIEARLALERLGPVHAE
jgi:RNA polymerase sigma factor (sigma-70 family)